MNRAVLFGLLLSACAASPPPGGGGNALSLFPNTTLYSGFETGTGAVPYKVTIAAKGAGGVAWKAMAPSMASVTGTDTLGTVTALAAGQTVVIATAGGANVQVPLTIATYNPSDRMAAASLWKSTCSVGGCHDASGPDVSPSDVGKHTDAQIQAAVTKGQNPEGGDISIGAAAHSFSIAPGSPEYAGIVAYLRALPPGTPVPDE